MRIFFALAAVLPYGPPARVAGGFRPAVACCALLLGVGGCPASETPPAPVEEEPIEPGTETVSTSWDVDLFSMYESPTIPRFDTQDGRRKLDGMTIEVDHTAVMTVDLENGSPFAIVASDYSAELYLQSIIQLGIENADSDGEDGPPFFGPGSFLGVYAVDLAAEDGEEASGPDHHEATVTDHLEFAADYDWVETPTYLEAMTGTEDIQLVVGGFSEMWVFWNNYDDGSALLYAQATAIQYSGTMTVTYEYSAAEE